MKQLVVFLVFILSINTFAQNFPGENVDLLIGKEIKVKPVDKVLQEYGYDHFYKNDKMKKKYECCQSYNTKYDALVNKVFKVISHEKYTNLIGTELYKLKIENPETGTLYFNYNPKYEHAFPFEVIGGLDYPDGFFCDQITKTEDKFKDETNYSTITKSGISLHLYKTPKENTLYLSARTTGSTLAVHKKGFTILLDNGAKINKPDAKIKTDVNKKGKGYIYSVFVRLTLEEIALLRDHEITDTRMYIYDKKIKGFTIKEYIKCLIKI